MKILSWIPMFLLTAPLFAGEEDAMPPRDQGIWQTVIMVAIAVMFFYFILWRPEEKRRKEAEKLRNAMKVGDKVTAMGILGTIARIKEQTVILRMVDGAKIEVIKAAITDVIPGGDDNGEERSSSTTGKRIDISQADQ